jgi:hypothetical protein
VTAIGSSGPGSLALEVKPVSGKGEAAGPTFSLDLKKTEAGYEGRYKAVSASVVLSKGNATAAAANGGSLN